MKSNRGRGLLLLFLMSLALNAHGKVALSPKKLASTEWDDSLKATLLRGVVSKGDKTIFYIKGIGNSVSISLPKKPKPLEVNMWIFEVSSEGQSVLARWNKKTNSWHFNLLGSQTHTVYVSKRINNTEQIPYAWFTMTR